MTAIIQLLQKILEKVQSIAESGGGGADFVIKCDYFALSEVAHATIDGTPDFDALEAKAMQRKPVNAMVYGADLVHDDYPYTRVFQVVNVRYDNYMYDEDDHNFAITAQDFDSEAGIVYYREFKWYKTGSLVVSNVIWNVGCDS